MISKETGVKKHRIREWVKHLTTIEAMKNKFIRRRAEGGGRKPLDNNLDNLLWAWIKEERTAQTKSCVTLKNLKLKAKEIAKNLGLVNFRASDNYINSFMDRKNLSYRRGTHKAQQNNKSSET